MAEKNEKTAISWDRVRSIFGNATSPKTVWEKQFDYNDDDLKRIAATSFHEINREDLWYYYHDLAYVELQPELFNYLFPVCLMEWHDTLMRNQSCSRGDADFHRGMRRGKVFEKMLSAEQREQVIDFFRDSFLQRLDAEPVTVEPSLSTHPFGWIGRFNSLGHVLPSIEHIWEPWWKVETRGCAIALLKYCSGLIYFDGENVAFGIPCRNGKYGPLIWESDSPFCEGWLRSNIDFLRAQLSFESVLKGIELASITLRQTAEFELATMLLNDAHKNHEVVKSRIVELPLLLSDQTKRSVDGWSI